ncbi:MAG: hypothetical protein Q4D98_06460 [Planctomycetia bacterium]|nr:hypothetical protein [Planctomycetia bacterium]
MSESSRWLKILLCLSLALLVGTAVTAGFSGMFGMLGDFAAARVVGWISAALGMLLIICFILLLFASVFAQISEKE